MYFSVSVIAQLLMVKDDACTTSRAGEYIYRDHTKKPQTNKERERRKELNIHHISSRQSYRQKYKWYGSRQSLTPSAEMQL